MIAPSPSGAEGVKTTAEAALYGGVTGAAHAPCSRSSCDDLTGAGQPAALYAQYDLVGTSSSARWSQLRRGSRPRSWRSSSVCGPRGAGGSARTGSPSASGCPNSGHASLRHSQPSSGGKARVAGWPQVGQAFIYRVYPQTGGV